MKRYLFFVVWIIVMADMYIYKLGNLYKIVIDEKCC